MPAAKSPQNVRPATCCLPGTSDASIMEFRACVGSFVHVYQYVLAAARTMNNMIAELFRLNTYIDTSEAATQSIRAGEHSRSMDGTKAITVRPATTKRSAADNGTTTPLQLISLSATLFLPR